jgi:hypothetical protein
MVDAMVSDGLEPRAAKLARNSRRYAREILLALLLTLAAAFAVIVASM